jgi:hypothetical protein
MHTRISNESVNLSEDLSGKLGEIMDSKHVSDEEHIRWRRSTGSGIFQVLNLTTSFVLRLASIETHLQSSLPCST